MIDLNSSEHLECQLVDLALLHDSLFIFNKQTLAASTELCCMLENSVCLPCVAAFEYKESLSPVFSGVNSGEDTYRCPVQGDKL